MQNQPEEVIREKKKNSTSLKTLAKKIVTQ